MLGGLIVFGHSNLLWAYFCSHDDLTRFYGRLASECSPHVQFSYFRPVAKLGGAHMSVAQATNFDNILLDNYAARKQPRCSFTTRYSQLIEIISAARFALISV